MFRKATLLIVAALVFIGVPSLAGFYTDWLWFQEIGYQPLFVRTLTTSAWVWAAAFLVALAVLMVNARYAMRRLRPREFTILTGEGPRVVAFNPRSFLPVAHLFLVILALVVSASASDAWLEWLYFRNATPFGESDPILGRDIGFYIFALPLLDSVRDFLMALILLTIVVVGAIYFVGGAPIPAGWRHRGPDRTVVLHGSILAAALLLVLAFRSWLQIPETLMSTAGLVPGASYIDVYARIPFMRAAVGVCLVGAVAAIAGGATGRLWPPVAAVGVLIAVNIAGSLYAGALHRFVVAPNEQVKETPFIEYNIHATRKAFALDRVEEGLLSGDALLTRQDIDRNAATLENVPLWDHQQLLETFSQIQEIRTYYEFASVDNDRYTINGRYRQIMLSARELSSDSLPNRTWINERLTFTHGYGLTLGPVNQVTQEGLPVLFIKNLPPESTVDLHVKEPSLYFGELSNDHVFVKTGTPEFHYPRGEDNVNARYEGEAGVGVGTFARKLLFAIRFRSLKTLLSNDLTSESRVLFYRRVKDRVSRLAPFLTLEADAYLSIADGRLYWIQDCYTTSRHYPYATPARRGISYIRNSIKAVVDAYHGTTRFYLVDPSDPIALSLGKMFPGVIRPLSEMPEGLRTRLRYPEGIFSIQAAMFATYHMTNPAVFYNKEDQWEIPSVDSGDNAVPMQPYYTIMKLPGEREPEFIQMLPFTPRQKDNMAAWMVSRSDADRYGQLRVFQFPKQKVIYGPRQVVARINQDQVISPQITLWNQQGSEVIQGTLLVIPVEESLIYIRPLYLRGTGGRIPELKRVIVAYENNIVMEPTFEAAINRIFPKDGQPPQAVTVAEEAPADVEEDAAPAGAPTDVSPNLQRLAGRARDHYQRAIAAQRQGNWSLYGEEIRRLGEVLEAMARAQSRNQQ